MQPLPEHTRVLVERLLEQYCTRLCPPSARQVVPIGFRIEGCAAYIDEHRRICGVPGTRRAIPLARFRYVTEEARWYLDHSLGDDRWRRYAPRPSSRHFLELLREFDADPLGRFWSQLDGKNLRWCSARGRCSGCEERYAEVLGLHPPARSS